MVDAFAWTTRLPIGHTHPRRENTWVTAVRHTATPITAVTAVTFAMVVTTVLTIVKVVIENVVVLTIRIATVTLMAVIVVTAIAIGAGVHLLVVTHPTIVGAGAIPEALREAVVLLLLGRQGITMAPTTAPAGKFALFHYLST